MRGGGNAEEGEGAATPLNEIEQAKQVHIKDLTGQRGKIKAIDEKYNAMKKDELGPRKANEFENLIHLYKDLNSKVDRILQNLESVDRNRFAVLESIKQISTLTKLNEYLEGKKKTQDEDFSTLFATIDSEETEINKLKEELDSKVRAEQKARKNRLNKEDEDNVSNEEENLQSRKPPPPPEQVASDNKEIPELGGTEDKDEAIKTSLPYFEAEKDRLESGKKSVNQKSESPDKTNILTHFDKEKKIIEEKIADLETKSKVEDIKELIAKEEKDRQARIETEKKLLELLENIPASSNSNPFSNGNMNNMNTGKGFNDVIREGSELQMMTTENNISTGLGQQKQELVEAREEAREIASSEQATQGSVSSEPQPDNLAGSEEMFSTSSSTESSGLPFPFPESTASAESQTPQPSGVTVENVEMVCKNLKNEITALEEKIAKLQESNTVTPTEKKKPKKVIPTNSQNDNKGTPRGGRKSRNNKKKKKSKAKKNKTRRRRRSKA